jgi:hypothetical protein
LGVACTAQLLPFQASARVTVTFELLMYNPTAVQAVLAVHETPFIDVIVAPLGVGVDWIDQPLPFQPSARLSVVLPLLEEPTAVQAVLEGHETPFRLLDVAPVGLGLDTTSQP